MATTYIAFSGARDQTHNLPASGLTYCWTSWSNHHQTRTEATCRAAIESLLSLRMCIETLVAFRTYSVVFEHLLLSTRGRSDATANEIVLHTQLNNRCFRFVLSNCRWKCVSRFIDRARRRFAALLLTALVRENARPPTKTNMAGGGLTLAIQTVHFGVKCARCLYV